MYMGPMSFQIQILGLTMLYDPFKYCKLYYFCFIKFLPSCMPETADPPWSHIGHPDPRFRVRAKTMRIRPDLVNNWKGALKLLFYKLCLKMIDHSSRSTWGPGPSGSRLRMLQCDIRRFNGPLLGLPDLQFGALGPITAMNVPAFQKYSCAEFCQDQPRGLDFYREHTYNQTNIALHVLEDFAVCHCLSAFWLRSKCSICSF
jgi:hypothetical protein